MDYLHILSTLSEDMHAGIQEEILFFHQVASGDVSAIEKNIKDRKFRTMEGMGKLSVDPLTNLKYHLVITAALIARMCIENGMEPEMAFRLSDYYICQLDHARNEDTVEAIHDKMILDYTVRMRTRLNSDRFSENVSAAINYIYAHMAERITIKKLAEHVGISTSLLSKQFSDETGQSVSDYIRDKKIEMSQDMLLNTDMSLMDIAYQLSFSSQSHFIQTFKNKLGITPKQYRAEHRTYHLPRSNSRQDT